MQPIAAAPSPRKLRKAAPSHAPRRAKSAAIIPPENKLLLADMACAGISARAVLDKLRISYSRGSEIIAGKLSHPKNFAAIRAIVPRLVTLR